MAVKHCADLNSSVAAVGRMSRQFEEAERRVKNLRRQVRDVKDSLRLGGSHAGMVSFSRCRSAAVVVQISFYGSEQVILLCFVQLCFVQLCFVQLCLVQLCFAWLCFSCLLE